MKGHGEEKSGQTPVSEIKKIKKGVLYKILGLILVIVVGIGVKWYMDEKQFNDEMLKIVNSKEAKESYERTIGNRDPLAFTEEGIIQSYKIDYESIEHNPMGGIMLDLIINDDKELTIDVILHKKSNGTIYNSAGGASSKLSEILEGENIDAE